MKAKEKQEIIEVFETYIGFLETNLSSDCHFLCYMEKDISKNTLTRGFINCGFNNRMLPNAIEYVKSQRPTVKMNKVIYNKPCFNRGSYSDDCVWWKYKQNNEYDTIVNTEKIEFLNHLISKLKK